MVGLAAARRLLASGWSVDLTGRDESRMPAVVADGGARFIASDRRDQRQLTRALTAGADLVVDCACYTADDARLLLPLLGDVGSVAMISSKAVYVDAAGNHVNSDVKPHFEGAIRESQATMAPRSIPYDSREGYGANKVAAELVLLDSGAAVSVLRASKVHGPWSANPREWVFVRRVLDGRQAVAIARRGRSVDHTTAAANLAALIETVATRPGARILNSADPDAPTTLEIARTVAARLGHAWHEMLVDGAEPGSTPWDAPHPIVLDTSASIELGYEPAGTYSETVGEAVDWLAEAGHGDAGRATYDELFARHLDYAAEDRLMASRNVL